MSVVFALVVAAWAAWAAWAAVSAQNGAPQASIWDGVYTGTQAARGREQYQASCASCHGEDLEGREGRSLVGTQFWRSWGEDTLRSLFTFMKTAMPHGQPGSLDDREYLDIVAYILEKNGYPSGRDALTPDRLERIRVIRKDGPGPVPDFALVTVVGCLHQRSRGWVLTNASEPARTRNPEASMETERQRSVSTALASHTFELIDAYYTTAAHAGHKMEVKGLLIRGTPDRLNVTSMQMLAERCAD